MAILSDFFAYCGQTLVAMATSWQRPLDPCSQEGLLWIGPPPKPPLIGNHNLVISRINALIAILSQNLLS